MVCSQRRSLLGEGGDQLPSGLGSQAGVGVQG